MKLEVRPFRPKHIQCIVPRSYELELRKITGRDWSHEFAKGRGYTLIADGVPVGAGGIVPMWAGVGEAWLFLSPWFTAHPKTSYKFIRELLAVLLKEGGFHRVQCPIRWDLPANKRLVKHLGFKAEGLLHRWGPDGLDYISFAMVAEEGEQLCLPQH
jgi:hypothetical protein